MIDANKLFALPLTRAQLLAIEATIENCGFLWQDKEAIHGIQDHIKALRGLDGDVWFDVLGWSPDKNLWEHVFTWRLKPAQQALDRAENDNSRFGGAYTHFVCIPLPKEQVA